MADEKVFSELFEAYQRHNWFQRASFNATTWAMRFMARLLGDKRVVSESPPSTDSGMRMTGYVYRGKVWIWKTERDWDGH